MIHQFFAARDTQHSIITSPLFRVLLSLSTLGPVAEHILPDLARAGLWQFIYDLDFSRNHEPADTRVLFGKFDHVFSCQLCALLDGNKSPRPFPPVRIAYSYHTAL